MKGKICIVTGGNSGIGKATVEGLARRGATVVLPCRDQDTGRAAVADIAAKVPGAELHLMRLDLASLASVRELAKAFTEKFSRLDVLIENAGVLTRKRQLTADGFEMDFGVNHLGHFLLTELLLPILEASAPSRVVVVSSNVHKGAKIDFDNLQGDKRWGVRFYEQSKLANILFVRALAKRLVGKGVVVNALHPGVIASELARDFPAPLRWFAKIFFKSTEQGARTSLYLATAKEAGDVSGRYFVDSKEAKPSDEALDDAVAERLWTESERLIAKASASVSDRAPVL